MFQPQQHKFQIKMAQDPNAHANDHGNGNGDGDEPKTQLEIAMDNLLELGIPNLQPLDFTEDQMNSSTVGELNDWAKNNLDAASFQEYRVIRRKDTKIEWLALKVQAINEARASLLARLQGGAPAAAQQQPPQQQRQPGEQGLQDDDVDMKQNNSGNGNQDDAGKDEVDKTEQRFKTMEKAILDMQQAFNQVLNKQYENASGKDNKAPGGNHKNGKDEKLDEKEKKKMNEDIARLMNNQRVENGSNVCLSQFKFIHLFLIFFIYNFLFFILFLLILFFIFYFIFHFITITFFISRDIMRSFCLTSLRAL